MSAPAFGMSSSALPQQRIDALGRQMLARERAELLLHLGIAHRVSGMAAMIFDPHRLAFFAVTRDAGPLWGVFRVTHLSEPFQHQ
jgi:hypothetical protein